ncbi:hypothetical protein [Zeimonas arvi]|uniref:EamA domain-containing protein n=1 Tax=Zeimonas arvi TaxID=2498847 RepID=A0A5C8P1C2_9BURK|nr:hypothetical protein [Zeimonas arvi]TXL67395.1 hypothetical protein FHP08_07295 [Zeimonas arvi]
MTLPGFLVFGDVPGKVVVIGAAIVIASGPYLLWRERGESGASVPHDGSRAPPTTGGTAGADRERVDGPACPVQLMYL